MPVRIITYNLKFLPKVEQIGGSYHVERAGRLASALKAHITDRTILCFQEVFHLVARRRLKKRLEQLGLEIVGGAPPLSGLLIASNMKPAGLGFSEFADEDNWDYWARKGMYGARVQVPGGELFVFTSHMQSRSNTPNNIAWTDEIQRRQLAQIRRSVLGRVRRKNPKGAANVVLCGDLNIIAEDAVQAKTAEYQQLRNILGLGVDADLFRKQHPYTPGYTYSSAHPHQRLDYVLDLCGLPFSANLGVQPLGNSACGLLAMPGPHASFSDHLVGAGQDPSRSAGVQRR